LCLSQIRKIIITTHHLVDSFDLHASGWEQKYRVKIHLLKEPKPLGTGGSIRFARDAINIAKPFVLTNGDTLCNARVATLMRSRGFPESVVMTLVPRRDPELNRIASHGTEGR